MLLWNGGCHVHERFSVQKIVELKEQYPDAVVMAHLECKAPVLAIADVKGSTAHMLQYAQQSDASQFIVATETGILYEMKRENPDKEFITLRDNKSCACDDCANMKLNTLEKLYKCLRDEQPEILMSPEMIEAAKRMDFLEAAQYRDEILKLEEMLKERG